MHHKVYRKLCRISLLLLIYWLVELRRKMTSLVQCRSRIEHRSRGLILEPNIHQMGQQVILNMGQSLYYQHLQQQEIWNLSLKVGLKFQVWLGWLDFYSLKPNHYIYFLPKQIQLYNQLYQYQRYRLLAYLQHQMDL